MCVPVPVEGLGKPAPGTMGSLSWGKDPRKDCGILRHKIKQSALYTSVVKRKKILRQATHLLSLLFICKGSYDENL